MCQMIGSYVTYVLERLWKDVVLISFEVVPEYNFIMQKIKDEMKYFIYLFIIVYFMILCLLHNTYW